MSSPATHPHVRVGADGRARIDQARDTISHLAAEHDHSGWSAEDVMRQHPDLRPEEVYAALTYFYDHHDEMVDAMKLDAEQVEALRFKHTLSRAELLARMKAPA